MKAIMWLFIVLATLVGLIGVGALTGATQGVGIVAAGCLLAIFARIAQAGAHHRDSVQAVLKSREQEDEPG